MIEIDINPFLFTLDFVGTLTVSWHGFFSFLAVATAVLLVARWAPLKGVDPDTVLSIAVWGIIGGIVGARVVHISDNWTEFYAPNPIQVFYIWTGGVAIWGGVLGGFIGGVGYSAISNYWGRTKPQKNPPPSNAALVTTDIKVLGGADGHEDDEEEKDRAGWEFTGTVASFSSTTMVLEKDDSRFVITDGTRIRGDLAVGARIEIWAIRRIPIGVIADLVAPALVFAQAIGRLGDIVNGEHCAKATEWFFGFQWIHPQTAATNCASGWSDSVHPAIAFEIMWNIAVLAVVWRLRGRLKPDGMLFAVYLALYSVGRFLVTFLREDRVSALGMQEAQYISLLILAITVPLLLAKARFTEPVEEAPLVVERGTRAVRHRRRAKR